MSNLEDTTTPGMFLPNPIIILTPTNWFATPIAYSVSVKASILFEGNPGEKVEEFIRQIRAEAFERGKSRDNDWIADLAATGFSGDALWWYEDLASDVQSDWALLRQALLSEYGQRRQTG